MQYNKSSDPLRIIATLLRDVQTLRSDVFDQRSYRLTTQKVIKRYEREGMSFLTKTLPRLGKALDKALLGEHCLDVIGFRKKPGTNLPLFMGELFQLVFSSDGRVLPDPCVGSIRHLRQICYLFYKYKLPYTNKQENEVISSFERTEEEIKPHHEVFSSIADALEMDHSISGRSYTEEDPGQDVGSKNSSALSRVNPQTQRRVIRNARRLLHRVFEHFDPTDVVPRHGPGAVSTRERLWDKYRFTNVPDRVAAVYPIDQYFYCSFGHVCDELKALAALNGQEVPARVILVQKDSRGPRLISCEPLYLQWLQQGLGSAIVEHVEHHALTRHNVHFTDQQPNQFGALQGSKRGKYSTLDLKEASDRVTVGLVRALFPSKVLPYLLATRSLSTQLPDGRVINLNKFAPMGSALCFPILALTVWAILTASTEDADARESILVYGDDVIVETAQAVHAIEQLESFGLKVNRDKSCTSGFFRESCGCDAFRGHRVTPVRLRTVWSSTPSPDVYSSWIAYANQLYDRQYHHTYRIIREMLFGTYGVIPSLDLRLAVPSLCEVPECWGPLQRRTNSHLQRREYRVRRLEARVLKKEINGWSMLLRWFTEGRKAKRDVLTRLQSRSTEVYRDPEGFSHDERPFSVSAYTKRGTVKLVHRWVTPTVH